MGSKIKNDRGRLHLTAQYQPSPRSKRDCVGVDLHFHHWDADLLTDLASVRFVLRRYA
jgi:hypothetical protein